MRVRVNYYEVRDSDLRDWGFDYLAWKNGPGVNLLNVGYNAGELVVHELLETVPYVLSSSWGMGGFFTAPQFDMSFIRCLQQEGNANSVATSSLMMINTPVGSKADLAALREIQSANPTTAPFIYRTSMTPEYQNIGKNIQPLLCGKTAYHTEKRKILSILPDAGNMEILCQCLFCLILACHIFRCIRCRQSLVIGWIPLFHIDPVKDPPQTPAGITIL